MKDEKSNVGYVTFTDMVQAHNGVFKSLVEKDGLYKTTEAKEINNAFGKQIAAVQTTIEAYRILGVKPTKKEFLLGK